MLTSAIHTDATFNNYDEFVEAVNKRLGADTDLKICECSSRIFRPRVFSKNAPIEPMDTYEIKFNNQSFGKLPPETTAELVKVLEKEENGDFGCILQLSEPERELHLQLLLECVQELMMDGGREEFTECLKDAHAEEADECEVRVEYALRKSPDQLITVLFKKTIGAQPPSPRAIAR